MKQSTWWTIGGIIALIGGILALLNPFAASLAASIIAGWAFVIGGVFQIVGAFRADGFGGKSLLALFGILSLVLGVILLGNPLAGMVALTLAVAAMFVFSGFVRFFLSFSLRGTAAFWPVLISSIISVVLGGMIFADFPASAASILGVLLGVELLFNGAALLSLAHVARRVTSIGTTT